MTGQINFFQSYSYMLYSPSTGKRSGYIEGFTQAFERAQAMDLLEGFDVPILARFITCIVTQGIVWWFEHDEPTPDVMADQVLRLLRDGLPAQLLTEDHTS